MDKVGFDLRRHLKTHSVEKSNKTEAFEEAFEYAQWEKSIKSQAGWNLDRIILSGFCGIYTLTHSLRPNSYSDVPIQNTDIFR